MARSRTCSAVRGPRSTEPRRMLALTTRGRTPADRAVAPTEFKLRAARSAVDRGEILPAVRAEGDGATDGEQLVAGPATLARLRHDSVVGLGRRRGRSIGRLGDRHGGAD